jgi:hypothetical protein
MQLKVRQNKTESAGKAESNRHRIVTRLAVLLSNFQFIDNKTMFTNFHQALSRSGLEQFLT